MTTFRCVNTIIRNLVCLWSAKSGMLMMTNTSMKLGERSWGTRWVVRALVVILPLLRTHALRANQNDNVFFQCHYTDSCQLLDEFEDVSDDEKRFLKLWNNFIRSCTLISDASIPSRCMHFVQKYANEMHQLGLRNELLLHLTNFWDYGLISPGHVETCLKLFDTRE